MNTTRGAAKLRPLSERNLISKRLLWAGRQHIMGRTTSDYKERLQSFKGPEGAAQVSLALWAVPLNDVLLTQVLERRRSITVLWCFVQVLDDDCGSFSAVLGSPALWSHAALVFLAVLWMEIPSEMLKRRDAELKRAVDVSVSLDVHAVSALWCNTVRFQRRSYVFWTLLILKLQGTSKEI